MPPKTYLSLVGEGQNFRKIDYLVANTPFWLMVDRNISFRLIVTWQLYELLYFKAKENGKFNALNGRRPTTNMGIFFEIYQAIPCK